MRKLLTDEILLCFIFALFQDYTGKVQLNTIPRWVTSEQMGMDQMGPGAVPMMFNQMDEGKNNLVVLVSNLPDEVRKQIHTFILIH